MGIGDKGGGWFGGWVVGWLGGDGGDSGDGGDFSLAVPAAQGHCEGW